MKDKDQTEKPSQILKESRDMTTACNVWSWIGFRSSEHTLGHARMHTHRYYKGY